MTRSGLMSGEQAHTIRGLGQRARDGGEVPLGLANACHFFLFGDKPPRPEDAIGHVAGFALFAARLDLWEHCSRSGWSLPPLRYKA
jgi:hypothetical protein